MTGLEQFLTALSGATSQFGEKFYQNKNLQMLDEQLRSRMGLQHGFNKENIVLTGDTQTKTNLDTAKGEQTLTDEVMAERLAAIPGMGVDPAAARNYEAQVRGFTPFRQQFVPMPHGSTTTDLGDGTTGVQAGPQQWDPNAMTSSQKEYFALMDAYLQAQANALQGGDKTQADALWAMITNSPEYARMNPHSQIGGSPPPPLPLPQGSGDSLGARLVNPNTPAGQYFHGIPFKRAIESFGASEYDTDPYYTKPTAQPQQPAKPAEQPQAGETAKPEIKGFKPEWEDEYQKMIAEDGVPDTPANRSFFMGMKNGR